MNRDLPDLPYDEWKASRQAMHLICQIVGKVRMAHHPKINHWWHVSLYVGVDGLTTRTIPHASGPFELSTNGRSLYIADAQGVHEVCSMSSGESVAEVYSVLIDQLRAFGYHTEIKAVPFDCFTDTPFSECTEYALEHPEHLQRYFRILKWLHGEFTAFRGTFMGKSSPVHLFWHSFDLAFTFFSGREAPPMPDADKVTQEAYSHEVISFGFWPGDEIVQMPAFYSYTHPLPDTLTDHPLNPDGAFWQEKDGGVTGILPYEDVRMSNNPARALRSFFESAYEAGVKSADWPDLRTSWA